MSSISRGGMCSPNSLASFSVLRRSLLDTLGMGAAAALRSASVGSRKGSSLASDWPRPSAALTSKSDNAPTRSLPLRRLRSRRLCSGSRSQAPTKTRSNEPSTFLARRIVAVWRSACLGLGTLARVRVAGLLTSRGIVPTPAAVPFRRLCLGLFPRSCSRCARVSIEVTGSRNSATNATPLCRKSLKSKGDPGGFTKTDG
mmetsp:Transcript_69006/g.156086  ORF Transcript_69006/g.156086 Transcript_69006/m.156086 type:complete len:200 (+) Transcript_69006:662-1261(+)